ncbi:M20/M25/M40 family metallo-hydrolase [Thermosulfuriphilus ammonigenes]|uniref:M20/M25/M40 family metallo-hydrolase n=1 Tax=Thermosulfuriphilus ammonigenes TaxID=1936021 RepID=A0A6G7PWE2_9BACT|nr:M20/M25/M40 family metallo-hydrolase [Thermosulfuriphilus ammonigenes]MBA2848087.1 tripeptide aminopeptidase [Thermosulfuriphilus ammonigenes]QIJ71733.1 M20/M25/M40 family metallo-hydrolase [Thermosulfuriphilus ammonigenes]
MINIDRLTREFIRLATIESPSRKEGRLATYLQEVFESLGARVLFDASASQTGSEVGNMVVKIPGGRGQAIFFNAHLDTVSPVEGIKVIFRDGVFSTDGRTILGADDKSAIAALIEAVRVIQEQGLDHPPLELVFTVCEEIGLLGAKNLGWELIEAPMGYALDNEEIDILINRAPQAIRFRAQILGRSAHAGLAPEKGINAIKLAAKALLEMPCGRIDEETTANVGIIQGGVATNIVPPEVTIEGEARSHDSTKLKQTWQAMEAALIKACQTLPQGQDGRPSYSWQMEEDYPLMKVPEEHPVIKLALQAAKDVGLDLKLEKTGGGSDANIFNAHGRTTVILGTGMREVHTTKEYLRLEDLITTTRLVLGIIRVAARG